MKTVAAVCLLFAIGIAANLTFGPRGFLPLDQSIIFDGGWRLLTGQVPFRDFTAPSGLVPSAMQAVVFRALGVTWFAYVLHAAIVNGLFAAATFALLRLCGATSIEAFAFGALTAFVFYPPAGTPFMDQHSFFFMLLMFLAAAAGTIRTGPAEMIAWSLVPALFILGYLSGQIPMSFGAVSVAVWVAIHPRRARRWLVALGAGTLAVAMVLLVLHAWAPFDWHEALAYSVTFPLHVAGNRTVRPGVAGPVRLILATLVRFPVWAKLWSLDLALLAAIPLALLTRSTERWPLQAWVLASCALTTAAFLAYTRTLFQTGLGLTMAIVAIATTWMRQALPRAAALPLIAVMGLAAARDAVMFVTTVDSPRLEHVSYDPAEAARAEGHLPAGLEFMRWSRGPSAYGPEELTALVRFLRDAPGNFLLIGDTSILYGLAGKKSIGPALWLDPRLTMPHPEAPEFAAFQQDLIDRVHRDDVRRIVLDRSKTWTYLRLEDFPALVRITKNGACGERAFGGARVLEICAE